MTRFAISPMRVTIVVVFAAWTGFGCGRLSSSISRQDSVVAFIAQIPSNSLSAPPSQYTVFMSSGRAIQFDTGTRDLRQVQVDAARMSAFREALQGASLASIPPANYFQPDAAHVVLGVTDNSTLRRYAWDERDVAYGSSASYRAFVDAWKKARAAIENAMPAVWDAAPDADQTIEKLLTKLQDR